MPARCLNGSTRGGSPWRSLVLALGWCSLSGCVTLSERDNATALEQAGHSLAEVIRAGSDLSAESQPAEFVPLDGTPRAYVEYALAHDHGLRARWERWRAATHRVARERRLPMPSLTYTVFIRGIETRVGPQRHKLSVRQRFPWPGELIAGADAAAAAARSMQREFEAEALEVQARVLRAYWRLWLVRETRSVEREQLELYEAILSVARGRLELGEASLVDVQQLELTRARVDDELIGLDELEREATANLTAAIAAPPGSDMPTSSGPPVVELPRENEARLQAALVAHPLLERWIARGEVGEQRAREARNTRAPTFSLSADWIEVGPASSATTAGSGSDAVAVGVGIELPLWQRSYSEDVKAARADAAAARAEWAAARDAAVASLSATMAHLRDTARRVVLYDSTLIPQAEGAIESALGGYAVGKTTISALLLAQRDLLELRLARLRLQTKHAVAWAELERVVGRSVEGDSVTSSPEDDDKELP